MPRPQNGLPSGLERPSSAVWTGCLGGSSKTEKVIPTRLPDRTAETSAPGVTWRQPAPQSQADDRETL